MKPTPIRWLIFLCAVVTGLVGVAAGAAAANSNALSAAEFKSMVDRSRRDASIVLLDIRTPGEFADGHIAGAINIDYYARDFVDRLKALDRQKTVLIYCRSGNRTGKSLSVFKQLGFARVSHLETGLIGWVKAHYPLVRQPG